MNELVKIFDALNISTNEVLKRHLQNGIFFHLPGFVGGHCIGVDPYYLIHKSQQVGIIIDLLMSVEKLTME